MDFKLGPLGPRIQILCFIFCLFMFDLSLCFIWAIVQGLKIHAKHIYIYIYIYIYIHIYIYIFDLAIVWAMNWACALKSHGWVGPVEAGLGVKKTLFIKQGKFRFRGRACEAGSSIKKPTTT